MMAAIHDDYAALSAIFTVWWRELQGLQAKSGKPIMIAGLPKKSDRQALAELRRIGIVDEGGMPAVDLARAISIPAFGILIGRLQSPKAISGTLKGWLAGDTMQLDPFAIAAATLARIRQDSGKEQLGATAKLLGDGFPETHVFAEPRFKRLLRCRDDWPDLMSQARRVGAILERQAPIGDLGASLVLWNSNPRIRRDWAFQYYQKNYEAADDSAAAPAPVPAI
jgi:CRISPR type I-E-associated protein CasB/Cse2